jgi:hypothetical protein
MYNIHSSATLKEAIIQLEYKRAMEGKRLKEQFQNIFESIKPLNLIKNSIREFTGSSDLVQRIVGAGVGLATGYIIKKIIIGSPGNILKKIAGSVLQFLVTNMVARNPAIVKSVEKFMLGMFRKKN